MEKAAVNIRLVALIAFAGSLPYGHRFPSVVNNMSVVLLGLSWVLEWPLSEKIRRFRENRWLWLFSSLYAAYLVAMLYTENVAEGKFELEKKMSLLFLPILLGSSRPLSGVHLRLVSRVFIWSCVVATLACFARAVQLNYREGQTLTYLYDAIVHDVHLPTHYEYLNYWYFTYKLFASAVQMHPVYLAMYCVFSSCLAAWLWWDRTWNKKWRNFGVAGLVLYFFVVVLLLSSRTQLFCMAVFGSVFAIYEGWRNRAMLRTMVVLGIAAGIGAFVVFRNPVIRERIVSSNRPGAHYSENVYGEGGLSLRLLKWKYTMEAILESPIAGAGTGDGQDELQGVYSRNAFTIGFENRFNPHNQFLHTWLDTGAWGLLILLACLLLPIGNALKQGKWIYAVFLVLFIISCTTESMLQVNKGIAFYGFFNSLFAFTLRLSHE
jgi:O-antigen ligase